MGEREVAWVGGGGGAVVFVGDVNGDLMYIGREEEMYTVQPACEDYTYGIIEVAFG